MAIRYYDIELIGNQPLIMHSDNIEWADKMEAWKNDKNNKKKSKAGDDRTPAYRWIGYLYHDGDRLTMPTENIMRSMMEGGAMVPVPGGRSGKTFKSQSQSGIMPVEASWPLFVEGKQVPFRPINELMNVESFQDHMSAAEEMGFKLFTKRARVGQQKHIRVRPMFVAWATRDILVVQDDQITQDVLQDILYCSGTYKGLGDWRPGSKTPGTHGTFSANVSLIKSDQKKVA